MTEPVAPGTWVEIQRVVLEAGERAPQVPEDTAGVPLEMRVRGVLVDAVCIGEEAEVRTDAGRRLRGVLREVNPAYTHGFGAPLPELLGIREDVRRRLRERESD